MMASPGLLGREQQLQELAGMVERERLVTLTGAPGIGKSRLALELAIRRGGTPADPVHVVELAPLIRARDVARAVAASLSVDEAAGERLSETLVARIHEQRLLLVLDNCEHLRGACAKLIEALLCGCPEVRVLATSREPLGLATERVWQVLPLTVPANEHTSPEALAQYAAAELFVERAAAVQPGFALNAYVAPAVSEIARRLDGVPLAIELAAARVDSVTPEEIAARLDDRFKLLSRGSRSAPARHQTLEAALDWSHDLLTEPERTLLRRLAVFPGYFDQPAVEAICGAAGIGRLVGKSLVAAEGSRYRLHETVKAYAAERLDEAGETARMRTAHAGFYRALAERAEPELTGPRQQDALDRLDSERQNLRSALGWLLSAGEAESALRLAGALVLFWRVRGHFSEGRELLEGALSAGDESPVELRAKALWGAGFLALMTGDVDGAIPALEESLALFSEIGDDQGRARALLILGNCMQQRDGPDALSLLARSATLARRASDRWCLSHALAVAGFEHSRRDELTAARPLLEECLAVAREAEDPQSLRAGLLGLGAVCVRQGDHRAAEPLLEHAVEVTRELGDAYSQAMALRYLGVLAIGRGEYERARVRLGESLALTPEVGLPEARIAPLELLAEVARAQGDHTNSRLLLEEAVAAASPATPFASLQGLGELAAEEGDAARARYLLDQALASARAAGARDGTAAALFALAESARAEGDVKRATALHHEAMQLRWEIGTVPATVSSLEAVAGLAGRAASYDHAATLLAAASKLRNENGYARLPWESARYDSYVALVRGSLSAGALKAAIEHGEALSLDQAVALAATRRGRRGRVSAGWWDLTDGERQVAALAAEGLTNPQIAERRRISHWTVKKYLSRVYAKLGVTGRTELAREVGRSAGRPSSSQP